MVVAPLAPGVALPPLDHGEGEGHEPAALAPLLDHEHAPVAFPPVEAGHPPIAFPPGESPHQKLEDVKNKTAEIKDHFVQGIHGKEADFKNKTAEIKALLHPTPSPGPTSPPSAGPGHTLPSRGVLCSAAASFGSCGTLHMTQVACCDWHCELLHG